MHAEIYDRLAPEKSVNLNANSDLIKTAKEVGVNMSQTFEEALLAIIKAKLGQKWLLENKEAIDCYNDYIQKHGLFAAGKRRF